jgi:hypothetical protein
MGYYRLQESHDSVRREIHDTSIEFGIPVKLVRLTKRFLMELVGKSVYVKISKTIPSQNGLKQ